MTGLSLCFFITFAPRRLTGYIPFHITLYYDRKVVVYDGKSGISAADRIQGI
jgi:hypothetical protein